MAASLLQLSRKWHRKIASVLFVFFFIISVTGFLLGWKSFFNTSVFKSPAKETVVNDLAKWLPLDSLKTIAVVALHEHIKNNNNPTIDRIDIRPDKGYAIFQFKNLYTVMLNAATGSVQQIDKKNSGLILKIHEGSLVDDWLGTGFFKRAYTSIIGLSFFLLALTGTWLWFKTRQIRRRKQKLNSLQ